MHSHSVFSWFTVKVAVLPPKEAEEITILWVYFDLIGHSLNVTHEGYWLLSKSAQHTYEIVSELGSLKKVTVEVLPSIFHTAIKDHPYFIRLLGVINPMVGDVPHLIVVERDVLSWYLFSIAMIDDFCHECEIVLSVAAVMFESPFSLLSLLKATSFC